MKVYLLFKNKDFDWDKKILEYEKNLIQDGELETILNSMTKKCIEEKENIKKILISSLIKKEEIIYRQEILKDCIKYYEIIQELRTIAENALVEEKEARNLSLLSDYPGAIINESIRGIHIFIKYLKEIKSLVLKNYTLFTSEGITNFFKRILDELTDEYFKVIEEHLNYCKFKKGLLIQVKVGIGLKGYGYTVLKINSDKWYKKFFKKNIFSFKISPRDENGAKALSELKMRGLNPIANTLAQSKENIHNFFIILKKELAFYLCCVELKNEIELLNGKICFPEIFYFREKERSFNNIYDLSLLLLHKKSVIGNSFNLENKNLIVITGANQGGKTTFLRSLIQAQILMQSGIFVNANFYIGNIYFKIFTHFKKEEDFKMKSGKFDEELIRIDNIINVIQKKSIIFFNESFSSTNEREGSEIAKQIAKALLDSNVDIFYVTHFYKFAIELYEEKNENYLFLRAEQNQNYQLKIGKPLKTSFGIDLYKKIIN